MASITTNYGLTKPADNETADIAVINTNMDVIDAQIKTNEDNIASNTSDIATNTNDISMLNTSLSNLSAITENYNSYASNIDANGIYTVVQYKKANGTLYLKSTLSGGTSPNYTTDTWQFYDALGTTVISTKTWTITYDTNGKITSKVVA